MKNAITRNLEPPIFNQLDIESTLIRQLSAVSQKAYAEQLRISESAASRRKSEGHFSNLAKEIAALNSKVVPSDAIVVESDYLRSLQTLALIGLESQMRVGVAA